MKEKEKSRLKKEGLKLQTRRRHVCGSETIREILLRKFFTRKFVSRKLFPEYFAAQVGVGWGREISKRSFERCKDSEEGLERK